ncbi:MAG: cytochrome c-type biogenesis protein [Jannaschia helgolandensis]|uniref:Cytochrome c-type biogenesis protein n=1 Tax=Jannaschia helgolandensis TaxID=188906 RepID=A0A1H7NWD5_9RHOB|nr:cytochrome c-type biogenesis protein [Jannaschia helgolandensis]SEL27298.1 cytochrome c-type biogenesis protein CcmH [Jannaschia helgolandensis]|tara:strand:- start:12 stop:464 length:453 start_codon:yes stop_codon:yes gene_type:complete
MRGLVLAALIAATPALAVEPGEQLDDPVLEARARELSKGLRCLVCRNENIDESGADLAAELRILLRERLVAGDTDTEIIDYMVARYGEYVLLKPTMTGVNMILWIAPLTLFLLGGAVAGVAITRHRGTPAALNPEEEARLQALMDGDRLT